MSKQISSIRFLFEAFFSPRERLQNLTLPFNYRGRIKLPNLLSNCVSITQSTGIMRKSNIEEPTRCNNNNLLISKISSTCFGHSFAHLQERKTEIFTAYGIVSCCFGRQGFGEQQRDTMCTVDGQQIARNMLS